MNPKILVPLVLTIVVAAALLGVGLWAKSSAPEGANAMTALYVNGGAAALLILLAVAGAAMKASARNIFTVAAIVCMLVTGAAGGRIIPARANQERYEKAIARWNEAVTTGKRPDNPKNKEEFLKAETDIGGTGDSQTHDKKYLLNALYATTGIALVGCLLLFATRPKAD